MDSRIREIEQWVAEAKSDLGECGREAYLRKLFLLDAEIRAMLKDNAGILPEAVSPRPREKRVRRLTTPRLALAGVAGTLLLAASTVYLAQNGLWASTPGPSTLAAAPATHNLALAASHNPRLPDGEILITDGWEPPAGSLPGPQSPLVMASLPGLPLGPVDNVGMGPVAPGGAKPAGAVPTAPAAAGTPGTNQATSVVLASLPVRTAPASHPATSGTGASTGFQFDAVISREVHYPSEDEFRNSFAVNETKDKAQQALKASGDGKLPAQITPEQPVDDVDNNESTADENVDKLDPEALKELLEKPFTR
jgi:hypothetical protein